MRKGNSKTKPELHFWDIATGQEVRSVASPLASVGELKLTSDGKSVFVRDGGASVRLLDAGTLKEVRQFAAKGGNARGLLLTPDQKSLFVAGNSQVTQYDVQTGKETRSFPVAAAPGLEQFLGPFQRLSQFSMAVSPDGTTLALPSLSTTAFWDLRTGKEMQSRQGHRDRIDSVAFAPGGKQVLTGSADSGLYLWDVAGGLRVREFVLKPPVAVNNNFPGREQMNLFHVRGAFTPDGKRVAGLRWGDKLHIWDAASGKLAPELGAGKSYNAFAFSADGGHLALLGPEGIELWNPAAGKKLRSFGSAPPANPQLAGLEQQASSAAFSPDGRLLATAAFKVEMNDASMKAQVDYLELASGQKRMHFEVRSDIASVMGIDFSSIMAALDSFVASFVFAPDGGTVAEAGFSSVKLRSLRTGKEIRAFAGKQITAATALFAPDGTMLLAGKQDGAVRLWDVATGTVLLDFAAHQSPVAALAFSPDGKLLATGARDSSVLIWDWDYIRRQATAPEPKPAPVAHERLWADLASDDAPRAFAAINALAASPGETAAFLKSRLRPVPPVEAQHLQSLLADLDHQRFAVRKKAELALEKLGDLAGKAIKDQLARSPSLETTRRLEGLVKKLDGLMPTPEVLQALRAIEVLERIGSHEARQVLDRLAHGAAGHRVTEQARLSLRWLAKRGSATQ
jgi:WD40 repeat protein